MIFALVFFCDPSIGSLLLLLGRAIIWGVSDLPGIFIIMSMEVANQYTDPDTGFKVTIEFCYLVFRKTQMSKDTRKTQSIGELQVKLKELVLKENW